MGLIVIVMVIVGAGATADSNLLAKLIGYYPTFL
jgi:hypothetical protein